MNEYTLTFESFHGEIIVEVIHADSLKEAKQICKDYYAVKKFV